MFSQCQRNSLWSTPRQQTSSSGWSEDRWQGIGPVRPWPLRWIRVDGHHCQIPHPQRHRYSQERHPTGCGREAERSGDPIADRGTARNWQRQSVQGCRNHLDQSAAITTTRSGLSTRIRKPALSSSAIGKQSKSLTITASIHANRVPIDGDRCH